MDLVFKNKKASYEYLFVEEFVAGMQLTGTEIKSIRDGNVSFVDTFCAFRDGELYVRNLHIAEYRLGTHYNHEPKRDRKLLLTKRELKKLQTKVNEKGLTIVAKKLFVDNRGFAKMVIALARGKNTYDKRDTLKKKDIQRDIDRRGE